MTQASPLTCTFCLLLSNARIATKQSRGFFWDSWDSNSASIQPASVESNLVRDMLAVGQMAGHATLDIYALIRRYLWSFGNDQVCFVKRTKGSEDALAPVLGFYSGDTGRNNLFELGDPRNNTTGSWRRMLLSCDCLVD